MRLSPAFSLIALTIALTPAACGGSSSSLGSGADAGPEGGSPAGDDAGGAQVDAATQDSAGGDDGFPVDAPSDGGAPEGDAATDAGSCSALATRKDCVACCTRDFPAGASAFDVAVDACACQADLCGPDDAGATPPDAGEFGKGACGATCGMKAAPDAVCQTCFAASLGTAAHPGPCRASVTSACTSSAACARYVACTDMCPAK